MESNIEIRRRNSKVPEIENDKYYLVIDHMRDHIEKVVHVGLNYYIAFTHHLGSDVISYGNRGNLDHLLERGNYQLICEVTAKHIFEEV